jgi:hypothetical protein
VQIALNGAVLGEQDGGNAEFDVTALLRERNELTIEVEGEEGGGLWGEVALEVRCAAFLRAVQSDITIDDDGSLQVVVTGELVGAAAEMLELYLLLDGATVAYTPLPAPVAGGPFRLAADPLPAERWTNGAHQVQVDLVRAATIWYRWEAEMTWERPQ